jgi:GT2 family glycosyltransferase
MDLSIIIVNYKTPELTTRCIESVCNSTVNFGFEIIVVDNDSQDNSEEKITKKFPNVKWINSGDNLGFGRANNLGAQNAMGKNFLLLNSDMLLEKETLEKSLSILNNDSTIGALGCHLINEDGTDQKSVYYHIGDYNGVLKDNLFYNYLFYKQPTKIKGIMGAFMLIPQNIFDQVNGFDPDFFMYAEELELCTRISKAGYKIEYTEETTAIHKHGGSSSSKRWSQRQNLVSNALLYLKINGIFGYLFYHLLFHVNTITNFVLMWKLDKNYRKGYWQVQGDYYSNYFYYMQIPFLYSKKPGNGQRYLRRG